MNNLERKEFTDTIVDAIFEACPDGFVVGSLTINLYNSRYQDINIQSHYRPEDKYNEQ